MIENNSQSSVDHKILDTTLRDGSYAINFRFDSYMTRKICAALQAVGVKYIEIGHGVGFRGSECGHGQSTQTDAEYLEAASSVLNEAKFGMFCIPGIAKLEDVDLGSKYGMQFIRIGTNVTSISDSETFIKRAKENGLFVCSNFMKSYALTPSQFASKVKEAISYGTDLVYIVDSAGGMFPKDITNYYEAVRKETNIPLGFHGHNNLSMANINSVHALDLGFSLVDSSLQGLGRSSGNAHTETLILMLKKLGYKSNIDMIKLLDIGFHLINPLIQNKGTNPLDAMCGYADFHSSYMHKIHKLASKYSVSPLLLILEACKIDKVDVDEMKLDIIAQHLQHDEQLNLCEYNFERYFGSEQDNGPKS